MHIQFLYYTYYTCILFSERRFLLKQTVQTKRHLHLTYLTENVTLAILFQLLIMFVCYTYNMSSRGFTYWFIMMEGVAIR